MKKKSEVKECSSVNVKQKKSPKKERAKPEGNLKVMHCSRRSLDAALELINEKMRTAKEKNPESKIQRCKSIPGKIPGAARSIKSLPCSATHKSVHLRNALISHNWKDAIFLLLNMLKDPKEQQLFRNIWKAFFIILQHSPHAGHVRMEQFRELCQQISGKDNLSEAIYLQ